MSQPQPLGQFDWPVVKTGDAFYRIVGLLIIVLCFGSLRIGLVFWLRSISCWL